MLFWQRIIKINSHVGKRAPNFQTAVLIMTLNIVNTHRAWLQLQLHCLRYILIYFMWKNICGWHRFIIQFISSFTSYVSPGHISLQSLCLLQSYVIIDLLTIESSTYSFISLHKLIWQLIRCFSLIYFSLICLVRQIPQASFLIMCQTNVNSFFQVNFCSMNLHFCSDITSMLYSAFLMLQIAS